MDTERIRLAQQAQAIRNRNDSATWRSIATVLDVDYRALLNALRDYRLHSIKYPPLAIHETLLTDALQSTFHHPPHLYAPDDVAVFVSGDTHAAKIHVLFAEARLQAMRWYKANGYRVWVLHCGDLLDASAAGRHAKIRPPTPLRVDREVLTGLLNEELRIAERVILLRGNHDDWLTRLLDGVIEPDDYWQWVIAKLDKQRITSFDSTRAIVHTGKQTYRCTHAINYSRNAGTTSRKLADKFATNIITHHEHHAAVGRSDYNQYTWVANGMGADDVFWSYVHDYDNTSPRMKNMFVVLDNGYCRPFTPYEGLQRWEDVDYNPTRLYEYEEQKLLVQQGKLDLYDLPVLLDDDR